MKKIIGVFSCILEMTILFILLSILKLSLNLNGKIVLIYIIIQGIFGHYDIKTLLIWEEISWMIKSHFCVWLIWIVIMSPTIHNILVGMIIFGIMFLVSVIVQRYLRIIFRNLCSSRVLIVGTGSEAKDVCSICQHNRFTLMKVCGYVSIDSSFTGKNLDEIPVYTEEDVQNVIERLHIDSVLIADSMLNNEKLSSLFFQFRKISHISYMPLINGPINFDSKIDDFDGHLLVTTSKGSITLFENICKRIFDICAAIVGCVLLIPITIFVYYENKKYNEEGSIFFSQERIGKDGKVFKLYKFRTMVPNAEKVLDNLMEKDEKIKKEYLVNKKLIDDPRITKVGKFLREKSLDEFPQFINVLKGDMSLIGPRPYLLGEKEDMSFYYDYIIKLKPGLTGMWQTHGRSDVEFSKRLKLDEYYYKNWSFKLDMTILIKTFKIIANGVGAR